MTLRGRSSNAIRDAQSLSGYSIGSKTPGPHWCRTSTLAPAVPTKAVELAPRDEEVLLERERGAREWQIPDAPHARRVLWPQYPR
jgi:hypothetical protein